VSVSGNGTGGVREQRKRELPKGIAALAIPAIGYLVVYAHESGFLGAFGVPGSLASLDLNAVLRVSLAVLAVLSTPFWIGNLVSMLWPEGRWLRLSHFRVVMHAGACAVGAFLLLVWPEQQVLGITLVGMGSLYMFMDFIWPLVTQRGRRPYREKLEAVERIDEKTKTLFDRVAALYGVSALLLVLLALVLGGSAYYLGLYTAQHRAQYLVVTMGDGREAVVLREYHDRMICSSFDRGLRQVDGAFFVLDITSESVAHVRKEKVGPLLPPAPTGVEGLSVVGGATGTVAPESAEERGVSRADSPRARATGSATRLRLGEQDSRLDHSAC